MSESPGSGAFAHRSASYAHEMPLHHVAYATRDVDATTHFYEDLMGFPLIHTEVQAFGESWLRHVFYDIGPNDRGETECIAFFQFHEVGEQPEWTTDVSDGVGLPFWVNHCAFRATAEQQEAVRARMTVEGIEPAMEREDDRWPGRDRLCRGQAPGVFLKPLDAEEFLPDRRLVVPRRQGRAPPHRGTGH